MHEIWRSIIRGFSRLGVFLMGGWNFIRLLGRLYKRGGNIMATTPVSINDATALGSALAADKIPVSRSGNLTPTTVTAANVAALATKSTVGLGNCDNTSDANKPISSAAQVALATKADREDVATIGNFNHLLTVADGDTFNVKDHLGVAQLTVTGTGTAGLRDKFTCGSLAIGSTDVTATASEINKLAGLATTAAELGKLAGTPAGLTSTEIGYLDGVTSAIQTQLNGKEPTQSKHWVEVLSTTQTIASMSFWSQAVGNNAVDYYRYNTSGDPVNYGYFPDMAFICFRKIGTLTTVYVFNNSVSSVTIDIKVENWQ